MMEVWTEGYLSKFKFIINCGGENFGYMTCNLLTSELSYQEFGVTGVIVFEHSQPLSKKEVFKLLPYIRLSDFENYSHRLNAFFDSKVIGFRNAISITFKGYTHNNAHPLLVYEMNKVYEDWFKRPVDKLYNYISDIYFSDFKDERCFLAGGLMANVSEYPTNS